MNGNAGGGAGGKFLPEISGVRVVVGDTIVSKFLQGAGLDFRRPNTAPYAIVEGEKWPIGLIARPRTGGAEKSRRNKGANDAFHEEKYTDLASGWRGIRYREFTGRGG
jgi:hypothetical protein